MAGSAWWRRESTAALLPGPGELAARAVPVTGAGTGPTTVSLADRAVRGWALAGVVLLIGNAVIRLGARGYDAIAAGLAPVEWFVLFGMTAAFIYFEGILAFQRRWVPRVVGRIRELHAGRPPVLRLLAPLYAMSLVGSSRRTMLLSWVGITAIVAAVIAVRLMPAPWRGIVDLAVAAALTWGLLVLLASGLRGAPAQRRAAR
jgi:hypothetical protein